MTSKYKKNKKSDINDEEVKRKDYKEGDSRKRKDSEDSDYDKDKDSSNNSKHKKSKQDDKRERKRSRSRSRSRSHDRKNDSDDERRKKSKRYENDYKERYEKRTERYQPTKRYWGADNPDPPYQKNSDRYWNKFSRDEDHYVGSRYYDVKKVKEKEKEIGKDKPGDADVKKPEEEAPAPAPKKSNLITSKTGGAYIPPAKLKMMQASIKDKSSIEYQRIAWEALKKSIHGLINKVNVSNLPQIIKQLFKENIVRGRGLLCKSIIQAQALSPTFTHVYAALVALINSRFPNIGELLLRRLVIQFRRGFKRNDKSICISASTFIAHLVNQKVAHEILALEILTLLVETPTDDSVEVAISFLKECGMKLTEVSSKGVEAIFQMLRNILHEGKLDKRVQYMIEVIFQIRKDKFKDHEAVIEELDVVEEEDQFTHLITLDDATNGEDILNVFKFDPDYTQSEEKFKELSKEMLGESEESGSSDEDEESSEEEEADEEDEEKKQLIIDNTETNLISLRRTIYLTIYSSLDYEECAHKLMKMEFKPGQEIELCNMILDCCCEMRTYEKFFGLLAQRFCQINKKYIPPFQNMFKDSYDTVFRLKPNQLRNVAKFFAHLLFADAISWEVLSCIQLNEDDTTSSGRIFIKILFQELAEYMGLTKLNERVKDPTLQPAFSGLFPRDNPKNTRFAINFFTSIGLGGLTDDLREHLKSQMKAAAAFTAQPPSSESSSSNSSSDSSSSDSSSESDSSDSSDRRKKKSSNKSKSKSKKSETKNTSKSKSQTHSDSKSKSKSKSKSNERKRRK